MITNKLRMVLWVVIAANLISAVINSMMMSRARYLIAEAKQTKAQWEQALAKLHDHPCEMVVPIPIPALPTTLPQGSGL